MAGVAEIKNENDDVEIFEKGRSFYNGTGSVSRDLPKAVEFYTKAANLGHIQAKYNLAYCYQHGEGTEKNDREALRWYTEAAKEGHVNSTFEVGWYNDNGGDGVPKNRPKAVEYYEKAARMGHFMAQFNLRVLEILQED